jgi:hypothetical protein
MLRKMLLACSIALPLGLVGSMPSAQADTDVDIHFGVPFYTHQVGPRYRYYDGYGWYDANRYPRFRGGDYDDDYVAVRPGRLSCGEARRIVRNNGFRNVKARDCDGRTYSFIGSRNGRSVVIYVDARNGRMWRA